MPERATPVRFGHEQRLHKVNGNNIIRFAVASPDDIRTQAAAGHVGNAWRIVDDLTPQDIRQPANAWFDYSTLSVNNRYVNWTVDIFRGNDRAVAMRINTNSLARNRFQAEYVFLPFHPAAAQEPPGTLRSYFTVNNNTSQVRMYSWTSGSATPIAHDVDIPSIPTVNTQINGTDGIDWNARASSPIGQVQSAAWSNNEMLVAYIGGRDECTKDCGGSSPTTQNAFPHVVAILDGVDTNARNGDWNHTRITRYIHSHTLNYSWPSLGVAASGLVGITLEGSADGQNPRAVAGALNDNYDIRGAWASDPGSGPQPGLALTAPATGFSGGTGDYYSLEPGPSYQSFVMPYRSIDPAPDGGEQRQLALRVLRLRPADHARAAVRDDHRADRRRHLPRGHTGHVQRQRKRRSRRAGPIRRDRVDGRRGDLAVPRHAGPGRVAVCRGAHDLGHRGE